MEKQARLSRPSNGNLPSEPMPLGSWAAATTERKAALEKLGDLEVWEALRFLVRFIANAHTISYSGDHTRNKV
jgi:hypothetical protein